MHFMLRKSWILMSLFDIIRFHCLALLNLELIKNSFPPPPPTNEYLGMGMVDGKLLLMIRT